MISRGRTGNQNLPKGGGVDRVTVRGAVILGISVQRAGEHKSSIWRSRAAMTYKDACPR